MAKLELTNPGAAVPSSETAPTAAAQSNAGAPINSLLTEVEPELRDPTKFGLALASINVVLYSVMGLAQWIGWGGLYTLWEVQGRLLTEAMAVMAINLVFGMLVVVGVFIMRPMHYRAWVRYALIALVALVAAGPRVLAMLAVYTMPSGTTFLVSEWISGFLAATVAVSAGVLTASLVGRARREQARFICASQQAQRASDELHTEEMRVRRMVADQLHGRLQFRLVTIAAGIDAEATKLRAAGHPGCASTLSEFAEQLEMVREQEVRALSHAVYPAGIELGAVSAIRAMMHRLPPQITARLATGPNLTAVMENEVALMPLAERLIAVFTIEEAITNALKHGEAKRLDIELEFHRDPELPERCVLRGRIDDDGRGLQPGKALAATITEMNDGKAHTGLTRHADRLANRGGHLTLTPRPGDAGTRLEFALPFTPTLSLAEFELAS